MAAEIIEHSTTTPLIAMLDEMARDEEGQWGIACVRREYLRSMTNEAFILSLTPSVQGTATANIFFMPTKIYIAWRGEQKKIYRQLRSFFTSTLILPGMVIEPAKIINYIDPRTKGEELKVELTEERKKLQSTASRSKRKEEIEDPSDPFGPDDDEKDDEPGTFSAALKATTVQIGYFNEVKGQKPFRKRLEILVVEDQLFSQKLLCEIIRGSRKGGHDVPMIEAVLGVQDAWKSFLKKVPDLVFIDLGLPDGSGHALARAIKEIDPMTQVIIVTANNYEEELHVARQNNVDAFIAKPYNKKQILDCIDKYRGNRKEQLKGATYGAAGQF